MSRIEKIAMKIDRTLMVHKSPYRRLSGLPFEAVYALFLIYTGISGIMKFGASSIVFSEGLHGADIFNVLFVAAGYLILSGAGLRRVQDEIMGLSFSVGLMLARIFVIVSTTGYNESTHNLLMIFFLSISASIVRLVTIVRSPDIIDIDIT